MCYISLVMKPLFAWCEDASRFVWNIVNFQNRTWIFFLFVWFFAVLKFIFFIENVPNSLFGSPLCLFVGGPQCWCFATERNEIRNESSIWISIASGSERKYCFCCNECSSCSRFYSYFPCWKIPSYYDFHLQFHRSRYVAFFLTSSNYLGHWNLWTN